MRFKPCHSCDSFLPLDAANPYTGWVFECQPRQSASVHDWLIVFASICLVSVTQFSCGKVMTLHQRGSSLRLKTLPLSSSPPSIHPTLPLCSLHLSLSLHFLAALVLASWGLRRGEKEAERLRGRERGKVCRRENGNDSFVGQAFCGKERKVTEILQMGGWEIERWRANDSDTEQHNRREVRPFVLDQIAQTRIQSFMPRFVWRKHGRLLYSVALRPARLPPTCSRNSKTLVANWSRYMVEHNLFLRMFRQLKFKSTFTFDIVFSSWLCTLNQ